MKSTVNTAMLVLQAQMACLDQITPGTLCLGCADAAAEKAAELAYKVGLQEGVNRALRPSVN